MKDGGTVYRGQVKGMRWRMSVYFQRTGFWMARSGAKNFVWFHNAVTPNERGCAHGYYIKLENVSKNDERTIITSCQGERWGAYVCLQVVQLLA